MSAVRRDDHGILKHFVYHPVDQADPSVTDVRSESQRPEGSPFPGIRVIFHTAGDFEGVGIEVPAMGAEPVEVGLSLSTYYYVPRHR